jgi:hypothetical protein
MGGRVVVFVKDHINCKHRPDLQIGNLECTNFVPMIVIYLVYIKIISNDDVMGIV